MVAAEVEEAMIGLAAQIDRGDDVLEIVIAEIDALKPVVVGVEFVRQPGDVPAELPVLVDIEFALGLDRAAQALVAGAVGRGRKSVGLLLVDPGHANAVVAVRQALTPVDLAEQSLLRQSRWDYRQIVIGRQVEEIGDAQAVAQVRAGDELRRENAGLPVDRRVGRRKIGNIDDRNAPDEHQRVLVIDRVRLADSR